MMYRLKYDIITVVLDWKWAAKKHEGEISLERVNDLRAISMAAQHMKRASIIDIPRDSQMKKGDMEEQEHCKLD